MAKHPIDRARTTDGGQRAEQFAGIERRSGDETKHPAVEALSRRPHAPDHGRRVTEYARIDRGRTA
ncbi:MAG: hypothetical protein MUF73_11155 [Rhodobacteraceae bacterium]|jgi:hypothetical protein|nr:hypothetical protein [Paracoccaceae bacterium]